MKLLIILSALVAASLAAPMEESILLVEEPLPDPPIAEPLPEIKDPMLPLPLPEREIKDREEPLPIPGSELKDPPLPLLIPGEDVPPALTGIEPVLMVDPTAPPGRELEIKPINMDAFIMFSSFGDPMPDEKL